MEVGRAGGEADQRRGAHPGGADARLTDMAARATGLEIVATSMANGHSRARNVEGQPGIGADAAGASDRPPDSAGRRRRRRRRTGRGGSTSRRAARSRGAGCGTLRRTSTSSAGVRPSGSAATGSSAGVDRRRADRRPFVEPAVGEVAVRAAAERRRVRRQRQLVLQRRAGVTVGAADRQLARRAAWSDRSAPGSAPPAWRPRRRAGRASGAAGWRSRRRCAR